MHMHATDELFVWCSSTIEWYDYVLACENGFQESKGFDWNGRSQICENIWKIRPLIENGTWCLQFYLVYL